MKIWEKHIDVNLLKESSTDKFVDSNQGLITVLKTFTVDDSDLKNTYY